MPVVLSLLVVFPLSLSLSLSLLVYSFYLFFRTLVTETILRYVYMWLVRSIFKTIIGWIIRGTMEGKLTGRSTSGSFHFRGICFRLKQSRMDGRVEGSCLGLWM